MKGLARHTAALDLPEDATQSMTLPDSDSEDNLDGSSPVMRPVNEGKDDGMPVPPPLVITTTIPEVNADEQSAAESGAESSTSIADDISEVSTTSNGLSSHRVVTGKPGCRLVEHRNITQRNGLRAHRLLSLFSLP